LTMDILKYDFFRHLKALPFVETIWVFGSRARGDNQDRADIDIAVSCPQATQSEWLQLMDIIENADTLLKIDCVRIDELDDSSDVRKAILKEGIKIYEKR
jgi:uncharacterized protein